MEYWRTCVECYERKRIDKFPLNKRGYIRRACQECTNKKARENRKKRGKQHLERVRVTRLKRKYGLTPEDYNKLYTQQQGKCFICQTYESELKQPLNVDHDHKTHIVRGLLCSNCNRGIGMFKDNPDTFLRAYVYLKGFK